MDICLQQYRIKIHKSTIGRIFVIPWSGYAKHVENEKK
jgi:hypothetical protein